MLNIDFEQGEFSSLNDNFEHCASSHNIVKD